MQWLLDEIRLNCIRNAPQTPVVTVDEAMCRYFGHIYIKVYEPDKPAKYGMLHRVLSNGNTNYVMNYFLYDGVSKSTVEMVKELLHPFIYVQWLFKNEP